MPSHLLKCLSTNHLAPWGSELYKGLIQQQRRELLLKASFTEAELADHWSKRWRPFLQEALTSDAVLLQNNSSALLLPCTFQVFPSAVAQLLESLDPFAPGHLHAWACTLSAYRATTGGSPWSLQGSSTPETLRLALESADDKVRLAALNILCCSRKSKDTPTTQEMCLMRTFVTQNLNCESSPFRQHLQAGLKKFLVRVRESCLACIRGLKNKKKGDSIRVEQVQDVLEQGIGERRANAIQRSFKGSRSFNLEPTVIGPGLCNPQALWIGWASFRTVTWPPGTVTRGKRRHYCCCRRCWRRAQTPGAQTRRRGSLQVSCHVLRSTLIIWCKLSACGLGLARGLSVLYDLFLQQIWRLSLTLPDGRESGISSAEANSLS